MRLTTPLDIDLLTFIKAGRFDFIKLGQTKEWIINHFPDPDETYADTYKSPIWHYGNIEFHFNNSNQLFLIHSDYIDTLTGGKSLNLRKWIFEKPERLTLSNVIIHLNRERISFNLLHCASSFGFTTAVIEVIQSGVKLSFTPVEKENEVLEQYVYRCKNEDSNTFILKSFSLIDK